MSLIPSICIVRSARALRFIDERVPGVAVPAETIARVEAAADQQAECFELAHELAAPRCRCPGWPGCTSSPFAGTPASPRCAHDWAYRLEPKGRPMDTVLQSRSKTVTIGAEQPFCVIGERINPTGRKRFAEQLRGGDLSTAASDALAQVQAGADVLDVNAGIPLVDEAQLIAQICTGPGAVDVPCASTRR